MMRACFSRRAIFAGLTAINLASTAVVAEQDEQRSHPTDEEQEAVDFVVELCLSAPSDIEDTRQGLEGVGWSRFGAAFEEEDVAAVQSLAMEVLAGAGVAFNFREDDLEYTINNAGFMAASVLGNSSLGRDQIGLRRGDLRLAILGIVEGSPYCMMTGPTWLAPATERSGLKGTMLQRSGLLAQSMGVGMGGLFQMGLLKVDDLRDRILADSELQSSEMSDFLDAIIMPVSIAITPTETISKHLQ